MYMNSDICIIKPKYNHKYTFILLHPMCCDYTYFFDFITKFKTNTYYSKYYNNIKFIIPNSNIMNINYPNNTLYNVNSWYNYYTCYDGINKIDKINIDDFLESTKKIIDIIKKENAILKSYKKIFIYGVSQGGTLIFNILKLLSKNIGGVFISKSIYMKKYINLNTNKKTPIFIYSGKNDQIYNINFQKKLIKNLKKKYNILFYIENDIDHFQYSDNEFNFILNNFIALTNY